MPPAFAGAGSALDRAGAVDPEDAMLVAVERDRFAMRLEILAGRLEIVEGRFRLDELQMHQAAGGVVDIDQQGGLRAAVFEPPVLGGVILAGTRDIEGALAEIHHWGQASWAWGIMVYAPVGMRSITRRWSRSTPQSPSSTSPSCFTPSR
jgi:hypothetical protein